MNRTQIDSIYLRAREGRARIEATEALDHFCQAITHHIADRTSATAARVDALIAQLQASVRDGWRGIGETSALVDQLRNVPLDDDLSSVVASYEALRLLDAIAGYTANDLSVTR